MKPKIILLIISFFIVSISRSQVVLLDSITNSPIAAVSVFDSNGHLISISDKNGTIYLNEEKLSDLDYFSFQHLSYRSKEISLKNILATERLVKLSPSTFVIDEIEINNKPKEWLILKGYFRALETFDGKNKYFSDGIVKFYIPLTQKKAKIKHSIEAYRVLGNKEAIKAYKEAMGPFIEPPRIPNISSTPIHLGLSKEYEIKSQETSANIYKQQVKVGEIKIDPNGKAQTYIDFVLPDSMIKKKLFRIEGIRTSQVRIETYDVSRLSDITLQNLQSWYSHTIGSIKRKNNLGYFHYEILSEFYVMERSFLTNQEVETKKSIFNKNAYLDEKSNYTQEFWKDLERYGIPSIAPAVVKQFDKELIEF
ncbi:hypothetical protein [Sphingobacterium cellulitidis]|uniref:hypothetical protein n=1 Tax=Sphingobacterium cellulitidis TaxID=1768011 RepID=UPI000B940E99|nr:hypothetical protein CHT99_12285 [Sphingobacterium cellulitidis]